MKKAFCLLVGILLILFSSSVFSQAPPYTITELVAEDVIIDLGVGSAQTKVSIECYDADGKKMGVDVASKPATLKFYKQSGEQVGADIGIDCSGESPDPPNTPLLTKPGVYYVTAELDCALVCCQAGGGCSAREWFAVSRPLPILNIPDNNPLLALIVCLGVLFIANKKK